MAGLEPSLCGLAKPVVNIEPTIDTPWAGLARPTHVFVEGESRVQDVDARVKPAHEVSFFESEHQKSGGINRTAVGLTRPSMRCRYSPYGLTKMPGSSPGMTGTGKMIAPDRIPPQSRHRKFVVPAQAGRTGGFGRP